MEDPNTHLPDEPVSTQGSIPNDSAVVVNGNSNDVGDRSSRLLKLSWRNPLPILMVLVIAAIGAHLILTSSASSVNESKIWSTAADWDNGSLSNTVVNNNSVNLAPNVTSASTASTNLALHRPASASSVQKSLSLYPKYVDDGNLSTRWGSAFRDPQWIAIDLGKVQSISEVKVTWETAYAKAYSIQVSNNNSSWTTIYSTTTGAGGVNDITGLSASGRYLRVYGTQRGTVWGYSIRELAVYGPSSTTTTTAYPSSGTVILPFDATSTANWNTLTAESTTPSGTSISYQARTSSDNSTWSSWTAVPSDGSLSGLTASRYIQIEATLSTTNSESTPILTQLTLDYSNESPPTVTLSATSTQLGTGQSTDLEWSSANATSCTASGGWSGTEATSGSTTISPTSSTTYSLSCTGPDGTTSATPVTVTVSSSTTSCGSNCEVGSPTTVDGVTCPDPVPVAPVSGYTITQCQDFNNGLGDFEPYDGGGAGTVVGVGRVPSQCTVSGGYLHEVQLSDGATCGGWMNNFDQQYGLWEVRMRAYTTGNGTGSEPHPVMILWPYSGGWTSELDFFETDIGSPTSGYLHCTSADQSETSNNCYILPTNSVNYSQWHVYSFVWTPTSMSGYIDGQLWWSTNNTSSFQPLANSNLTLQLDNLSGTTPVDPGEMDINWAHMFAQ